MRATLTIASALLLATVAHAAPDGWHTSLKDGVAAARKSGKPLLVVTAWKSGV